MKTCLKCKKSLAKTKFYTHAGRKTGLMENCKDCHKERVRSYTEAHRTKVRDSQRKAQYGITGDKYASLLLEQNNLCAICGSPEKTKKNGKVLSLSVDHDHTSGNIRGLLCLSCNTGLGKFQDSENILRKAAAYLEYAKHAFPQPVAALEAMDEAEVVQEEPNMHFDKAREALAGGDVAVAAHLLGVPDALVSRVAGDK